MDICCTMGEDGTILRTLDRQTGNVVVGFEDHLYGEIQLTAVLDASGQPVELEPGEWEAYHDHLIETFGGEDY